MEKPPIGLMPRTIHELGRIADIIEAMERYSKAEMPIPCEWIEELKDLLKLCR